MSVGLDTSVALRLLTGTPDDQAEAARSLVASAESPVVISDLVIAETYLALRHHYDVPHREAVLALSHLLRESRIRPSGEARTVLTALTEHGATRAGKSKRGGASHTPDVIGRLIVADYARDDLPVATFDRDLAQLDGTQLLQGHRRAARTP